MKKVILFVAILLCITLSTVVFIQSLRVTQISTNDFQSINLTNTQWDRWFNNASKSNPYVFGWENNTLYYKDAVGKSYAYNADTGEISEFTISREYLRQTQAPCNATILPPFYDNAPRRESWKDLKIEQVLGICRSFSAGGTTLLAWPLITSRLIEIPRRILVIQRNNQEFIINERRLFADATISPNGEFIALTVSEPLSQDNPPRFSLPTNIYIVRVK